MTEQYQKVKSIAVEAGKIALRHFEGVSALNVESKGHLDLVTAADREVETFISDKLAKAFPGDGIFGEEGGAVEGTTGRTWVIDPIDGTFNFVRGSKDWGISIGLFENGTPSFGLVNAPARGEIFAGGAGVPASLNDQPLPALRPFERKYAAVSVGIHPDIPNEEGLKLLSGVVNDLKVAYRVTGSSVVSLIDIATGTVDGYIGLGIPSWDILGMLPCLKELGVSTTVNWETSGLDTKLDFACGRPEMLALSERILGAPALGAH